MLVTPVLGEEISKLLPELQRELAAETSDILQSMKNEIPRGEEARRIIKGEDIEIMLKHEIKIWRRYYG